MDSAFRYALIIIQVVAYSILTTVFAAAVFTAITVLFSIIGGIILAMCMNSQKDVKTFQLKCDRFSNNPFRRAVSLVIAFSTVWYVSSVYHESGLLVAASYYAASSGILSAIFVTIVYKARPTLQEEYPNAPMFQRSY